jgi:hypothetical protein
VQEWHGARDETKTVWNEESRKDEKRGWKGPECSSGRGWKVNTAKKNMQLEAT